MSENIRDATPREESLLMLRSAVQVLLKLHDKSQGEDRSDLKDALDRVSAAYGWLQATTPRP